MQGFVKSSLSGVFLQRRGVGARANGMDFATISVFGYHFLSIYYQKTPSGIFFMFKQEIYVQLVKSDVTHNSIIFTSGFATIHVVVSVRHPITY